MNKSRLEDYIKEHGSLTYTNRGVSMMPLIRQGRDMIIISAPDGKRYKRGDVVLYRRGKQYVLHRIVKVNADDYVILGDNCIQKEYGIRDEDIIGVMTGFIRDGKEHSVQEIGYRIYSAWCLHMMEPGIVYRKLRRRIGRVVRKMKNGKS